ncbi:class I SAM-dependent methyltransferase [Clostridium transplantifaecale]|uniref:class I SAM-dependent methyltransferase n=1 Tax=Clostridium transplantifaecale TaxID=2479838 RepID=UPI000F643A9D|nr:class I SAM-dependent methyltransferase [Clostridium transplantifaecale]
MEQESYWNEVSETKTFTTPFHAEEFTRYVDKEKTILDVGCGYGRTLEEVHRLGYCHLTGMDFSEGMIKRGRAQYPWLDLRVMQTERIDLPDGSVDAVILFAVLTCIREDEKQKKLIGEIQRVLRPGGILYVNDFLLNTDERNTARYEKYRARYQIYGVFELPEGAVCRHHEESWIQSLLSGFTGLRYEHLVFTTMNGNRSNGFYYIGRK